MVDERGLHRTQISGDEPAESVSLDRLFGQLALAADQGVRSVAHTKLQAARACYLKWGAHAKVAQLDAHFGDDEVPDLPIAVALEQRDVEVLVGIGLAICSNIVTSHDGLLSVCPNADGPGSTFSFVLPLFKPTSKSPAA